MCVEKNELGNYPIVYREVRMQENGRIVVGGTRLCWHHFTIDMVVGCWRYRQCGKCNRRIARCRYVRAMGVVDWLWLRTGKWTPAPTEPPPKPRSW